MRLPHRQATYILTTMNEYIFYTIEDYTTVPNEDCEVDNCHVIGIAYGDTEEEALAALLADNPWILPAGLNPDFFICRQLASLVPLDFEPPEPALMYGPPETMFSPHERAERRLRNEADTTLASSIPRK